LRDRHGPGLPEAFMGTTGFFVPPVKTASIVLMLM
jgi:hypothetical protein